MKSEELGAVRTKYVRGKLLLVYRMQNLSSVFAHAEWVISYQSRALNLYKGKLCTDIFRICTLSVKPTHEVANVVAQNTHWLPHPTFSLGFLALLCVYLELMGTFLMKQCFAGICQSGQIEASWRGLDCAGILTDPGQVST